MRNYETDYKCHPMFQYAKELPRVLLHIVCAYPGQNITLPAVYWSPYTEDLNGILHNAESASQS